MRRWLKTPTAEVVLTIGMTRRDDSPRWKQVVEVRPGLFTHHLGLHDPADIDDQVVNWLQEAFQDAG